MIPSNKKYKRNPKLLWWQIHIGPFGTNPLENLPWAPNGQGKLWKTKKSDRESQSKQPTAFSVLMRFRSTNRNRFSPTNGREISSSVFGQTRLGQLYMYQVAPGGAGIMCSTSQGKVSSCTLGEAQVRQVPLCLRDNLFSMDDNALVFVLIVSW